MLLKSRFLEHTQNATLKANLYLAEIFWKSSPTLQEHVQKNSLGGRRVKIKTVLENFGVTQKVHRAKQNHFINQPLLKCYSPGCGGFKLGNIFNISRVTFPAI